MMVLNFKLYEPVDYNVYNALLMSIRFEEQVLGGWYCGEVRVLKVGADCLV